MKNKVYYGEYSLKHWVDLILSKNIVLPDYQRSFVWEDWQVKDLIQTFEKELYIPPVTIGSYQLDNGKNTNLVLDGQQRLTSILLAYLGVFPNKEYFNNLETNDSDYHQSSDSDDRTDFAIKWTLRVIQQNGSTLNEVKDYISKNMNTQYFPFNSDIEISNNFLENHYLGFSFLIPKSAEAQQEYYISTFRAINVKGKKLSYQESREALYYLKPHLKNFFDPEFISNYKIERQSPKIDFIRYLSIISQYKKNGVQNILLGLEKKLESFEEYYKKYVFSVVYNQNLDLFGNFSDFFEQESIYEERLNSIKECLIEILGNNYEFISIIYSDLVMFGLVNYVLFDNKRLDTNDSDKLRKNISKAYKEFKEDEQHIKNPNTQKYIKKRLEKSLEIYKEFIDESA